MVEARIKLRNLLEEDYLVVPPLNQLQPEEVYLVEGPLNQILQAEVYSEVLALNQLLRVVSLVEANNKQPSLLELAFLAVHPLNQLAQEEAYLAVANKREEDSLGAKLKQLLEELLVTLEAFYNPNNSKPNNLAKPHK